MFLPYPQTAAAAAVGSVGNTAGGSGKPPRTWSSLHPSQTNDGSQDDVTVRFATVSRTDGTHHATLQ